VTHHPQEAYASITLIISPHIGAWHGMGAIIDKLITDLGFAGLDVDDAAIAVPPLPTDAVDDESVVIVADEVDDADDEEGEEGEEGDCEVVAICRMATPNAGIR
jgi:hypothetical protein